MMYKIIGGDGKEYGPVSADELRQWIAEARLNAQSLACAEGTREWKPLSSFPEFAQALGAKAAPPPPLSAIGGLQPPGDAYASEILLRPTSLKIGACLSRSWKLVTSNFALLVGASAVVWALSLISQVIPFASLLLGGPLFGGLCLVFLRRIRSQPAEISGVFDGFRIAFLQLMLASVVSQILATLGLFCCLILPGIYLVVAWVFCLPLAADKRLEFWAAMELSRKVVTRVWFEMLVLLLIVLLPFVLFTIAACGKILSAFFVSLRELSSSGSPDPDRIRQIVMQVSGSSIL